MTWVALFAGIAVVTLVLLAWYAWWLWTKVRHVGRELSVLGGRAVQLVDLLGQVGSQPPSSSSRQRP